MFPFDFSSPLGAVQDLQSALANAVNAGIVLAVKLSLLWLVYMVVAAFLPRAFRLLLALGVLALVLAYPAQLSAAGDVAVSVLARAGLVPQVQLPDLAGMLASQAQAPQIPGVDLDALLAQLGL